MINVLVQLDGNFFCSHDSSKFLLFLFTFDYFSSFLLLFYCVPFLLSILYSNVYYSTWYLGNKLVINNGKCCNVLVYNFPTLN